MTLPGYKEVRTELRITPAKAERVRYMQEELVCPECRKDGDGTIVQAKTPAPLMPHSPASPSAVAYVMFDKSFVSVPYYRQKSCMAQPGLDLPRETMANWYIKCALEYFQPVYDCLHGLLLQRAVIHADETTCRCCVKTGKPPGGSKLEKAVNYAVNHRETLQSYMLDGRCELSNNAAERRAKSYAIGRKNSLFHASAAGAEASALVYSMIESAKANKINVFQYLYILLLYMPDYKDYPDAVEMLLPWSDFIKERCTGLIDVETITPENKPPLPL